MRFIFLFFIFNLIFTKLPCFAEGSNILLIGLTLNELTEKEREKLAEYTIMERPSLPAEKITKLAQQSSAEKVIVKQSSGLVYEYSPKGHLMRRLESQDIANFTYSTQMNPLNINSQYSQQSSNQNQSQIPPIKTQFPIFPQSSKYIQPPINCMQMSVYNSGGSTGNSTIKSSHMVLQPNLPFANNFPPNYPQPWVYQLNGGQMPTPTTNSAQFQRPFPGANISNNWYPGKSAYSYLPGEGDILPYPGITTTRKVIKELAGFAQNNAYPFWFDNYLTTSSNANSLLAGPNAGTNAGFPALEFNADTSSSAAVVGAQWFNSGIGIGATVIDAILSKKEIESRRRKANEQANGTANYVYPNNAYTVYPSLPYQPIPRN